MGGERLRPRHVQVPTAALLQVGLITALLSPARSQSYGPLAIPAAWPGSFALGLRITQYAALLETKFKTFNWKNQVR